MFEVNDTCVLISATSESEKQQNKFQNRIPMSNDKASSIVVLCLEDIIGKQFCAIITVIFIIYQQTVYLYSRNKQVQPFLLKGKVESYLFN